MRLLSVGDNALDVYKSKGRKYVGGQSVSVTYHAVKSGLQAGYIGEFADDSDGEFIKSAMTDLNIDISHCRTLSGTTRFTEVELINGDRCFGDSDSGGVAKNLLKLDDNDYSYIKEFDIVHMGRDPYNEHLIKDVAKHAKYMAYDFSDDFSDKRLENFAPVLDLAIISGAVLTDDETENLARKVLSLGAKSVIITLGGRGSYSVVEGKKLRYRVKEIKPTDTLGAGDSFIGNFLAKYFTTKDLQKSIAFASDMAAKTCRINGSFNIYKEI